MTDYIPTPRIGIIMGSDSDLPVMQAAADVLDELEVPYEMTIVSAHRTPKRLYDYAETAADRGLRVVIAGAGGAAHLPGMVAAITPLPVVGVPVKTSSLSGQDSLLSIVQMPAGVPVATVAINGARNAGLLAAQILGAADTAVRERIAAFKRDLEAQVLAKVERMAAGEITAETVRAARGG
jgi:5-(carboxyamino)imidazole ribonucleotide mutase